ncbi:AraC family transcriptional regulator [Paenibacillus sp. JTLBN-2024]
MIRVINCGYNYIHRDGVRIDRPAGAGNYAFVFFRSHAEVVVGGRRLSAAKNSYVLFRPSTPHAYRHVEKPFVNDWFHCEGAEMEALLEELGFACDEPVKAAFPASLTRSIMELQHVNRLGGPLRDGIVDLDLRSLLLKLSNWQQLPPLPEKTERYYRQLPGNPQRTVQLPASDVFGRPAGRQSQPQQIPISSMSTKSCSDARFPPT